MTTINYRTFGLIRDGSDVPAGGDIADVPMYEGERGPTIVSGPLAFDSYEDAKAFRDNELVNPEDYRIIILTGSELEPDSEG